jgi:hypothetical protein
MPVQPDHYQLRQRSPWRAAAWICVILAALLLCTEAALRFGLGLGDPVLIAPDPYCSYITKPNQNVFRFFVHTYVNRYGMRSEEVSPTPPPGVTRLLFVGDSITYGTTHVDQRRLFTQIVRRGLPGIIHHDVQVLNASANGWAPDNELAWVQSRGIFHSDFVLLVLNDGDLTQPRSNIADVGDGLPRQRPLTAIGELYTRFIKPRFLASLRRSDPGDVVIPNEAVEHANLADMDRFLALVKSQGGRMILVYIPMRADIPTLSAHPQSVYHHWSAANGVPIIDLTDTLAPHPVQQVCLYDHIHLNTEGNAVVGAGLLENWPAAFRQ